MANLILASSSPRRKELLEKLSVPFESYSPNIDESIESQLPPGDIVTTLAARKAKKAARLYPHSFVIGSDTIVVYRHKILGKPASRESAKKMLSELSGNTHSVYTGVAVIHDETIHTFYEKTDVIFWELSDEDIEKYVNTGEPFDKAGAYGIQGQGGLLVKSIQGDYYSVVGLPIGRLLRVLKKMGYPV
ncbi:Maf family protein [Siminovitchia sediminis]|uniref:dTTP/UTP pyrophosphatase n=1 Tax=Siminovitchia sediminis TaxID=1274353 RepID=A0ABW4KER9_9BACI